MKKHYALLFVMMLLGTIDLFAQEMVVTGTITDEGGNGLPGAAVQIMGTSAGTTTDVDGNYSISVEGFENPVLAISYIGYLTENIPVNNQTSISISLVPDAKSLDEVIVIGYGVTKKSLVTGAIAKIGADDIEQTRSTRVESALQGKTAGVLVQQSSGAPGAEQNIIIRGVGSDNAVRPIYVIDGMRTDGIDWLDPQDIESIEILKDAASAAIYGTEGGNGVVLITTKTGKEGKTNLSYDASYGIQNAVPHFKTLDTEGYLKYYRTALMNDRGVTAEAAAATYPDSDINTDWLDQIFVSAPIQKHKLSIDGGTEKARYYFSLSYTDQDGIIGGGEKSKYTRYATKFNLDSKATNWLTAGTRISYSHITKRGISQNDVFGSVTNNAVVLDPTTPVYYTDISGFSDLDRNNMQGVWGDLWYENPGIQDENGYFGISQTVLNEIQNPVQQIHNDKDQDRINKILGGVYGDIRFFEGLNFRTNFDIDLSHNYNRGWDPRTYINSMNTPRLRSRAFQEINMYFTWQWESYMSFNKQFGDHTIGAVLGASAREYTHEVLGGDGEDLRKESDNYAWVDYGQYIDTLNNTAWGRLGGWERLASIFGRVTYSYRDKYMFTSNFRRDGSSKFGPDNKVGIFPSLSFGWVVTREDFWQVPVISFLKPRFSWGKNGVAQSLGWDWKYLPQSSTGSYYYVDGNDQVLPIIEPTSLVNPEYQWEKSIQTDYGIDMGFFNNRLTLTTDYYIKKSSDFLFQGSVPLLAGNDPPTVNAGTIENKGIEFELGFNNNAGNFFYNISFTASRNKSEVTEVTESISYLSAANVGTFGDSKRFEEGYEPWYFYGFESDGIFTTQGEIDAHVNSDGELLQPNAVIGDVKYLDIAGSPEAEVQGPDGTIDDNDRTYLGSPYPKWITGMNINLRYKGFDFNLATYAQFGNKTLLAVSVRNDIVGTNKPDFFVTEAWISEDEQGDFPRPTVRDRNRNFSRLNEFMLQDGSFLRISNIALGYTLPSVLTDRIGMQQLRIYVAVDNLYTFTKYKGMEPEVGGDYWGYRGQQWAGIDRAVYPRARTITGGINVNF
jgi:TonB-linked SusC/RagA family outer membrane protein